MLEKSLCGITEQGKLAVMGCPVPESQRARSLGVRVLCPMSLFLVCRLAQRAARQDKPFS
eukprot:scaffold25165_cov32-Tisochrysis_lutea.AAC.1